ncbi:hypothetical protein B0H14DRAFT_2588982 [Mycena olivaceomarginata]|nr:hypothetical protein B0H14DRAFT_2588982 [Mycena olivaceomarginata]
MALTGPVVRDWLLQSVVKLYGPDEMKPNHHWSVHVPDQALDYGPLYGIWAFLTERLNKVLKNLNSNNWGNGLLEVSMMREFHRTAQLDGIYLNGILNETSGDDLPIELRWEHEFIELLFSTGEREALGTIQDAAAHALLVSRGAGKHCKKKKSERIEDDAMRLAIVNYYNQDGAKVHLTRDSDRARQQGLNTEMLGSFVETYKYTLLDGRRVTSTAYSRRGAGSSLIQIHWKREVYAGEIREIFRHTRPGISGSE